MTVRIYDQSFVSEAAAAKNPQNYIWYQVTKGKVLLDSASKQFDVELTKGDKFGIRQTKTALYLIDADDLTVQFKISQADFEAIMKNSKGYSGDIGGAPVRPGTSEGTPVIGKTELLTLDRLIHKAKGEIADGFNPIGKNPKLNAALMTQLKALNRLILKYRKDGTKLPAPVETFAKKYGLGEVGASDFMARLRNPKDGASIVPKQRANTTAIKSGGKISPAVKRAQTQYKSSLYRVENMLTSNLHSEISGSSPSFSKGDLKKALRVAHLTAKEALEVGGKLDNSPLTRHYGFGTSTIKSVLAKPDFNMEDQKPSTTGLRKAVIKRSLADLRGISAWLRKNDSSSKSALRGSKYRLTDLSKAMRALTHNNVAIPKSSQPAVDLAKSVFKTSFGDSAPKAGSTVNRGRGRGAALQSMPKAQKHPGLEVEQGSVPKQDMKADADKRITDKNLLPFLKKKGVELVRGAPGDSNGANYSVVYRSASVLSPAAIRDLTSALENAGWDCKRTKTGRVVGAKGKGNYTALRFKLTGTKRYVEIPVTGTNKGILTIKKWK